MSRPADDAPLEERAAWWFDELRRRASNNGMPWTKQVLLPIDMVAERVHGSVSRLLWELLLERRNRAAE